MSFGHGGRVLNPSPDFMRSLSGIGALPETALPAGAARAAEDDGGERVVHLCGGLAQIGHMAAIANGLFGMADRATLVFEQRFALVRQVTVRPRPRRLWKYFGVAVRR